jgi:hypothetical protein
VIGKSGFNGYTHGQLSFDFMGCCETSVFDCGFLVLPNLLIDMTKDDVEFNSKAEFSLMGYAFKHIRYE